MPLFYVVLIACFLALSPTSWVFANQPASPTDSLATTEQDAIDSINQLSSSDGPEIQSRVTGSSELTGIMVDRTITMAGKTFYRAFSQRAMDNLLIGNATLTIQERPDARWGSQVWIMEGNRMYFRTQLSPRISEADLVAGEAVQIVEEALLQHQLASALTSDKDLGREELF